MPALGRQKQPVLLGYRPAWFTKQAPGQPKLHNETLSKQNPNLSGLFAVILLPT